MKSVVLRFCGVRVLEQVGVESDGELGFFLFDFAQDENQLLARVNTASEILAKPLGTPSNMYVNILNGNHR